MRKLSFAVVFLLVQLNVFAQSAELEVGYDVRLQRSWTLLFGVIYKKKADLLLR